MNPDKNVAIAIIYLEFHGILRGFWEEDSEKYR